ncbi:sporulation protein YqfD [Radiobacillus sp. PE A8.2]|uniref:sporulation protein YqfD n=1 Tax=Radiobacillus sp. PE A8.2 TaxID=3380349 RepID=UPI003890DBD2
MKSTQGVFFTGYVTVRVMGHHPELFFDLCTRYQIMVWNMKKIDKTTCEGNVRLKDLSKIRGLRRKTTYKLAFKNKKGLPFLSNKLWLRKPLLAGLLISILFVVLLSNIVWDVTIKGVHPELEQQINKQLVSYGIEPGAFKFHIKTPGEIQQQLLTDIPELLWVGVSEKGTTYQLEGVEKTMVSEPEKQGPSNLVASKKGVIVDMFVSKGRPMVKINQLVNKGDMLVSGNLSANQEVKQEDEEDQEPQKEQHYVHADGEVIATTWYKLTIEVPLDANYDVLTGKNKKKYFIKIGPLSIPIWGFTNPDYKEKQVETHEKPFYFLQWKLPVYFTSENVQEKRTVEEKRNQEKATTIAISQAEKQLRAELGKDAEISFQKVLHESIDNGKVNLILYFKVLENIAKNQPISQGD